MHSVLNTRNPTLQKLRGNKVFDIIITSNDLYITSTNNLCTLIPLVSKVIFALKLLN